MIEWYGVLKLIYYKSNNFYLIIFLFNNIFILSLYLICLIFIITLYYAIMKEREELGCYRISIGRQCIDEESVYVKNTKAEFKDTCEDLHKRMESILSYQEKAGI